MLFVIFTKSLQVTRKATAGWERHRAVVSKAWILGRYCVERVKARIELPDEA